jgi:hypothetical protein
VIQPLWLLNQSPQASKEYTVSSNAMAEWPGPTPLPLVTKVMMVRMVSMRAHSWVAEKVTHHVQRVPQPSSPGRCARVRSATRAST